MTLSELIKELSEYNDEGDEKVTIKLVLPFGEIVFDTENNDVRVFMESGSNNSSIQIQCTSK